MEELDTFLKHQVLDVRTMAAEIVLSLSATEVCRAKEEGREEGKKGGREGGREGGRVKMERLTKDWIGRSHGE